MGTRRILATPILNLEDMSVSSQLWHLDLQRVHNPGQGIDSPGCLLQSWPLALLRPPWELTPGM